MPEPQRDETESGVATGRRPEGDRPRTSRPTILWIDADVLALGAARMADALANSFLVIVLPLYIASGEIAVDAFGLTEAGTTGLVLAVFGVVSAGLQPVAGRLSDRVGKRKLFVLGGVLALAAANTLYVVAENELALLGIRALQGAAVAFTIPASIALVSEVSTITRRGGNMGIYNALRLIGFGLGPLAAGVVVEGGPYRLPGVEVAIDGFAATFYLAGLAALLSAGLVALFVRDPEGIRPTTQRMALRIRAVAPDRILDPIFTLGLATLSTAACIALLAPIEPAVNARLDQGATLFAVEFAAFIFSLALFQPLIGSASDRWGRRRFVIAGLLALIPTTLLQGLVVTPGAMIAARVAQGVAGASVLAPALALAGDLSEEGQSGAQLSVLTVSFVLGLSLGQLLSGFLLAFGYVVPFAFGAGLAVIGAALVSTQVSQVSTRTR